MHFENFQLNQIQNGRLSATTTTTNALNKFHFHQINIQK